MQITVTQENIHNGIRESQEHCAIALAIRDTFRFSKPEIEVGDDYAQIDNTLYDLPIEVISFIQEFDDGGYYFEPFTFELNV